VISSWVISRIEALTLGWTYHVRMQTASNTEGDEILLDSVYRIVLCFDDKEYTPYQAVSHK
jgi:hypothetical protein